MSREAGEVRQSVFENILGNVRRGTESSAVLTTVAADEVAAPKEQPRKHFDREAMESLVSSVSEHGILQPLLVRPTGDGTYEVVSGERRLRAARDAGLKEIPVVIREVDDRQAARILALVENLQRQDLNAVEETEGLLSVLELSAGLRREELVSLLYKMERADREDVDAKTVSSSAQSGAAHNVIGIDPQRRVREIFDAIGTMELRSFVTNRLPLLNLDDDVLAAVRDEGLAYTKAKLIARVEDQKRRTTLLREAIEQDLAVSEIRRRVAEELAREDDTDDSVPEQLNRSLGERASKLARRMSRSRTLADEEKARRAEELLDELDALLSG